MNSAMQNVSKVNMVLKQINNCYSSRPQAGFRVEFTAAAFMCLVFNWRPQVGRRAVGLRETAVCVGPCWASGTAENTVSMHTAWLYHSNESNQTVIALLSSVSSLKLCVYILSLCSSASSWSLQDSGSGLETWALWQCWLRRVLRSTAVGWRTLRSQVWRLWLKHHYLHQLFMQWVLMLLCFYKVMILWWWYVFISKNGCIWGWEPRTSCIALHAAINKQHDQCSLTCKRMTLMSWIFWISPKDSRISLLIMNGLNWII